MTLDRSPTRGRLRHDSVPMQLYHAAKQQSAWDPRLLDVSQDVKDFAGLTVVEKDTVVRLCAMYLAAEEGMTRDLLPLLTTVVREGRLEEELFLTTFLADEAKHIEFFRRVLDDVCGQSGDLLRYQTPTFQRLFSEKLPAAMQLLLTDSSPAAQATAMVHYTLVGEGVLGEAGYHVFRTTLDGRGLMPGFREGLRCAQADEDRHMAYGIFMLSRLMGEDPEVWDVIRQTMDDLIPDTLGIVTEFYDSYDPIPFGLSLKDTVEYAMEKFAVRWESLEEGAGARQGSRRPLTRRRRGAAGARVGARARAPHSGRGAAGRRRVDLRVPGRGGRRLDAADLAGSAGPSPLGRNHRGAGRASSPRSLARADRAADVSAGARQDRRASARDLTGAARS